MVKNYYEGVSRVQDANTKKALMRLFLLYSYDKIIEQSSSFFESRAITADTFKGIR
jgi:hypothetical protein